MSDYLITGVSGFIGRALAKRLLMEGFEVSGIDLNENNIPGVQHIKGDITDFKTIKGMIDSVTLGVIHLAGKTRVVDSIKDPSGYFMNNVHGTHNILLSMAHKNLKIVFASSGAVYGNAVGQLNENLPLKPLTPYGATKAAAESLINGYATTYSIISTILRLTNVYGPDMGSKDSYIARIFKAILLSDEILVYGDGEQTRDYIFVDDVINAISFALLNENFQGTVGLGYGHSISVNELLATVESVTKKRLKIKRVENQVGEMRHVAIDNSKLKSIGFTPLVDLETGLRETWSWFEHSYNRT